MFVCLPSLCQLVYSRASFLQCLFTYLLNLCQSYSLLLSHQCLSTFYQSVSLQLFSLCLRHRIRTPLTMDTVVFVIQGSCVYGIGTLCFMIR